MENILINFAGNLPSQQMMNRSINLFEQFSWSLVFDHRDSEDVGVNSVVVIIVVVRILFFNTPPDSDAVEFFLLNPPPNTFEL